MLEARPPPAPGLPQIPRSPFSHAVLITPADRTGACRFLPCPRGLPRLTGGSASTTSLSRPAQASLALRPARLLARPKADFCPEAPALPVTRLSRSVATMLTDNYMDGSSFHWRSAPLGRTVNYRLGLFVRVP